MRRFKHGLGALWRILRGCVSVARPRRPDSAGAAVDAAASLQRAEIELARQRAVASAEEHHVLDPLRRMRERNHIAQDFMDHVRRGYS
jgi:hypothetical protein